MGRIVPQRLGGGLRRKRKPIAAQRRQARPEKEEGNAWRDLANVTKGIGDVTQILGSPLTMPIAYGLHKAFTGAPEAPLTPEEKAEMEQWKKWMSPKSAGAPSETAQNPPLTPGQRQLQAQMSMPQGVVQSFEDMPNRVAGTTDLTGRAESQLQLSPGLAPPPSYQLIEPAVSRLNPERSRQLGPFGLPEELPLDDLGPTTGDPNFIELGKGTGLGLGGAILPDLDRPDPGSVASFEMDGPVGYGGIGEGSPFRAGYHRTPGGIKFGYDYGLPFSNVDALRMPGLMQEIAAQELSPTGPKADPQGMAPQGPPMPPLQGITDYQSAQAFLEQFQPPDPTLPPPDILENMSVDQLAALMSRATDETDVEALKSYARNEEMPRSLLDLMTGGPGRRVDKAFAGKEMYRRPRLSAKDVVDLQYKTEALRSMRGKERRAESGERRKEELHPHDVMKSKWDAKKSEHSAKLTALKLQRKLSRKGTNINAQRRLILKKLRKALGPNATNEQKLNWINQNHPNFIQTAAFVGAHSKGLTGRDYDGFDGMQMLDHAGHAIFHLRSWPKHPKLLKSPTPPTGAQDSAQIALNDAVANHEFFSSRALEELGVLGGDEKSMAPIVKDGAGYAQGEGAELTDAAKAALRNLDINPNNVVPVEGKSSYELVKKAVENRERKLKASVDSKRKALEVRKK